MPHRTIKVYGPPTTSGTRDAFVELCVNVAAKEIGGYPEGYSQILQDGVWVDSGENDNLIVQKLTQDKNAFGVFGFKRETIRPNCPRDGEEATQHLQAYVRHYNVIRRQSNGLSGG